MNQKQQGFTLIELLLVLVIISISIGVILPTQSIITRQKINTNMQTILMDIQSATIEAQRGEPKKYILNKSELNSSITSCEFKISYLNNKLIDEISLDKLEFNIDTRGRLYTISDENFQIRDYIREIHINLEAGKIKKSITISGITATPIEQSTNQGGE